MQGPLRTRGQEQASPDRATDDCTHSATRALEIGVVRYGTPATVVSDRGTHLPGKHTHHPYGAANGTRP